MEQIDEAIEGARTLLNGLTQLKNEFCGRDSDIHTLVRTLSDSVAHVRRLLKEAGNGNSVAPACQQMEPSDGAGHDAENHAIKVGQQQDSNASRRTTEKMTNSRQLRSQGKPERSAQKLPATGATAPDDNDNDQPASAIYTTDLNLGGRIISKNRDTQTVADKHLLHRQGQRAVPRHCDANKGITGVQGAPNTVNHSPLLRSRGGKASLEHGDANEGIPRDNGAHIHCSRQDGIVTLQPTLEQWHDFPKLLAAARAHGAAVDGVFKIIFPSGLPDDFQYKGKDKLGKTQCRCYKTERRSDGVYHISTTIERQSLSRGPPSILLAQDLMKAHERRLDSQLDGIYYRTDLPAKNAKDRRELGLPARSLIWPLKGNKLDDTTYSMPGIHNPYAYESGSEPGAMFSLHIEDWDLYSLNALHEGRKLWICIPPSSLSKLEAKLGYHGKVSTCSRSMTHEALFISEAQLSQWDIDFRLVDQRASEVVVTFPMTYHEGFTAGYTMAEAVNYADSSWPTKTYRPCTDKCSTYPIDRRHMALQGPQGGLHRDPVASSRSEATKDIGDIPAPNPPCSLPQLSNKPDRQVAEMVRFILTHDFPPKLLDCKDAETFSAKIEQWAKPMGQFDSVTLRFVLSLICQRAGFVFTDARNVDERVQTQEGTIIRLAFPDKLAFLLCKPGEALVAFGLNQTDIQEPHVNNLIERHFPDQEMELQNQGTGDSCPGIVSCIRLEEFIKSDTLHPRPRYLQMLLQSWMKDSQLAAFTKGRLKRHDSDPPHVGLNELQVTHAGLKATCDKLHDCIRGDLSTRPDLMSAFYDTQFNNMLSMEHRARLLQIIMQCSLPSNRQLHFSEPASNELRVIVRRIIDIKHRLSSSTFELRFALVLLAREFHKTAKQMEDEKTKGRQCRDRERHSEKPQLRNHARGKAPVTKALEALHAKQEVIQMRDLKAYIGEGTCLDRIGSLLGFQCLATFPGNEVSAHSLVLQFPSAQSCFPILRQPIPPSSYHCLTENELKFFVKWLPSLRPDIMAMKAVHPHAISAYIVPRHTNLDAEKQWQAQLQPAQMRSLEWRLKQLIGRKRKRG